MKGEVMKIKLLILAITMLGLGFGGGYIFSNYDFTFSLKKTSSGDQASTGEMFCNENIPLYQQTGCTRKPDAEQKMPSYEGKPCDQRVPMMYQHGCIEP